MKKIICATLVLSSCATPIVVPADYEYKEVTTPYFKLATWQKNKNNGSVRIYIEGDGNSFNSRGYPTSNPTPRGKFLRQMAFDDKSANVVYLARPCQFVKDNACQEKFWTTGRFAPEVIASSAAAIKKIANGRRVELIGFSGGAQVAGLVAVKYPEININKIVNYAPNLDHETWTKTMGLYPLSDSLSLNDYQNKFLSFEQMNYIAQKDRVIPMDVTINFLRNDKSKYTIINDVGHNFK